MGINRKVQLSEKGSSEIERETTPGKKKTHKYITLRRSRRLKLLLIYEQDYAFLIFSRDQGLLNTITWELGTSGFKFGLFYTKSA